MYKIAHCADVHIKNLKYHYEYRKVFESMYESLREEEVDFIYVGGDIAHTKTQISPEFVELCSEFLSTLADIAPTYVILGNHDGNLRNSSRQDAITPIVNALDHPHLHLLKNSGEVEMAPGLVMNVLSVFDEENWVKPTDSDKINIAVYHGSIAGVKTDIGWIMDHGDHDVSIFADHDYAMLGDIHKTNQILDTEGRVRYSGSIVQQNHGETNDKGFLIWEIENKDVFKVKHIKLLNPRPFVTIELTPRGRMPKGTQIAPGARLRLVSNNNLPLNVMKRAVEVAKHRFKPESITFLNRAAGERGTIDINGHGFFKENLRDISVQEKLMREYLKDYEASDEMMERVFALNQKYNSIAEAAEDVARNVNWKLNSFEWDNLFNYGKNNKIDFEKLNGIVGIFGKNYSGKSSIIDGLLYTLFNTTSKNERKNLNVINQNRDSCRGKLTLQIGEKAYTISRKSEKYIKRLKGEESLEAKTDLDFDYYDPVVDETHSLNDTSRIKTDAAIRKHFGTIEDFLLTSMASQLDSLSFIKEGSTRRKEILAKFLDLEVFEKKFRLAKEDSSDLKGVLRRIGDKNFEEEVTRATEEIEATQIELANHERECDVMVEKISLLEVDLATANEVMESIPSGIIDILDAQQKKITLTQKLANAKETNKVRKKGIAKTKSRLTRLRHFLGEFDIDELERKQEQVEMKQKLLDATVNKAKLLQKDFNSRNIKLKLLDEVPCGDGFPMCKFIHDAHEAKKGIRKIQEDALSHVDTIKNLRQSLAILEPAAVSESRRKYNDVLAVRTREELSLKDEQVLYERSNAEILSYENDLASLQSKIEEYEENRDTIENFEHLTKQRRRIIAEVEESKKEHAACRKLILQHYSKKGSLDQKLKNLTEQQKEMRDIQQEYAAYDLYLQCMHSNGIAYDIIKKQLPAINNEVAKVLANIVSFEVFFEDDGARLNIFIKHPKHDPRPIEMGSGAEKTIAAMAIRLALLSVSNLPKGDIFILDEPGTALDADNMEGFVRILELIKSYFKTVVLISHLDNLKDCVDTQIIIEKPANYAKVVQ
jgi:DNA repair exonuclease SbcCD ATPase subunit/DNA repair exonuclease SbcCD nuclease subunit